MTEAVGDEGHTTFLTPDAVKDAEASLSGEYVGIGTIVDESDNGLRIEGVFPDSPADKAGLGVGSEITAVDGVTIVTTPWAMWRPASVAPRARPSSSRSTRPARPDLAR